MAEPVTIAKLLAGNLPRLKHMEEVLDEYEADYPYKAQLDIVDPPTYLGIELEIENIHNNFGNLPPHWIVTGDGSLRNGGVEFISLPIRAKRLEYALQALFKNISKDRTYSERTSIHVHMNIRTLTVEQLESLVLTYMVFEYALFNWVGQDRVNNIFCVPLVETQLTNNFCKNIKDIGRLRWTKYTALNLAPVTSKGTIEFRHMHGTDDIPTIINWTNFLLCLKRFALKNDPAKVINSILELNTSSAYAVFAQEVFGQYTNELLYDNFEKDISSCISHIKSLCLENEYNLKTRQEISKSKLVEFLSKRKSTAAKKTLQQVAQEVDMFVPPVQIVDEDWAGPEDPRINVRGVTFTRPQPILILETQIANHNLVTDQIRAEVNQLDAQVAETLATRVRTRVQPFRD